MKQIKTCHVNKSLDAYCSNCYNGKIVLDNFGTMFCNACFKDVKINIWDGKVGK